MSPKDLKLRERDTFQYFENKESCGLIKENYCGKDFSFNLRSKDDIIKAVKNHLCTKQFY